ncbi:MAG TPA: hypothetical protein VJ952_02610, partial [Opitutales bacterium]|nr:hypothetical protein [Opitutales bacterium]
RTLFVICLLATLAITYSGLFDTRKTDTWEEDYALLANASLRTARDEGAIRNARAALAMNPKRADMHAVLAQAHFNQWALNEEPEPITREQATRLLELTRLGSQNEEDLKAVSGIYEWKLGQRDSAIDTWQSVAAGDALARLCLIQVGQSPPPDEKELRRYGEHPSYSLLLPFTAEDRTPLDAEAVAQFIDALLQPAERLRPHDSSNET